MNKEQQQVVPSFRNGKQPNVSRRTEVQRLRDYTDGRDENNLCEFPLAALTDQIPDGQKTLEFSDTIQDRKTGQVVERRVCITGSDRYGLPRPKDEDVLLALLQLTRLANNFQNAEFYFTKHEIIAILGWDNRGWAYDRIEESLHRWKGVSIHYQNAWRDNANGSWRSSEAVGVVEYFRLTDGRRRRQQHQNRSRLIWNKLFFESFQAGYLKKLDFAVYRNLDRPAAKRAYRFLDKRFFHTTEWEFDLRTFACDKIGLSREYDTGQLKARLKPALRELQTIGFIQPPRYRKQCPGVWKIGISKQHKTAVAKRPDTNDLAEQLIARGVSAPMARRLVQEHSADEIRMRIDTFDALITAGDGRVGKNPAGFLVASIRDEYTAVTQPPGRNAKSRRREAALQATARVSKSRPEQIDIARLEKWLDTLDPAARQSFEERALAAASEFQRTTLARLKSDGSLLWRAVWAQLLSAAAEREGIASNF